MNLVIQANIHFLANAKHNGGIKTNSGIRVKDGTDEYKIVKYLLDAGERVTGDDLVKNLDLRRYPARSLQRLLANDAVLKERISSKNNYYWIAKGLDYSDFGIYNFKANDD